MNRRPGDIVLSASTSKIGRVIRIFSRQTAAEQPTMWNHTSIVGSSPNVVVEALPAGVVRRGFYESVGGCRYIVYRPIDPWLQDAGVLAAEYAEGYIGRRYGFVKIGAHLADYALSRILGREVWGLRQFCNQDRYPICSWVVAHSWQRAAHITFGVPASMAQPDDIGDWCGDTENRFRVVDYA